jgi:methionine-rich copper-binding protein CopC
MLQLRRRALFGWSAVLALLAGLPAAAHAHAEGLTPGDWSLAWQALSIDGHITRGEIPFRVAP